jgi:hypothetical protein
VIDRFTTSFAALIVLLLVTFNVGAATIRGVPSCFYWLRDREPGGQSSYFNAMWLVGYLSGAAVHSDKDVLRSIDSESIAGWMDRYCKTNPTSNIAEGGEMLFDEIARRTPVNEVNRATPDPAASTTSAQPVGRASPPASRPGTTLSAENPVDRAIPQNTDRPAPADERTNASASPPAPSASSTPSSTAPTLSTRAAPSMQSVATPRPAMPLPSTVDQSTAAASPPPDLTQRAESQAAPLNEATYLPRALMLAHTLPLRNSKYQFKAEAFAKANGCAGPAASMNIRTATSETFAVTCADGRALSVRCDPDCRDLQ